MLIRFDEFLQIRFQKGVNFIDETFGINKFQISKWFYIMKTILLLAIFVSVPVFIKLLLIILAPSVIYTPYLVREIEEHELYFKKNGALLDPHLQSIAYSALNRVWNMFCFFIFTCMDYVTYLGIQKPPSAASILFNIYFLTFGIAMYVTVCTPRPPNRKSKMREWYEGIISIFQPLPQPVRVTV
jgi:hypothetical protein